MIELSISSVIIIAIMILFTFFILKNCVKRINDSVKKYFIDKMQDFNYIIEEKEKELEDLRKQISEAKYSIKTASIIEQKSHNLVEQENVLEDDEYVNNYNYKQKPKAEEPVNYNFSTPQYKEANFFSNYKFLNNKFEVNNIETINKFVENIKVNQKTDSKYETLKELRLQFSKDIVYQCLTLENSEQYKLIEEVIDKEQDKIINFKNQFKNPNKFKITEFIEHIDNLVENYDPTIYIYVGMKDLTYDYINENIKTLFYKNMSQGIIIKYKGKIYDYSI